MCVGEYRAACDGSPTTMSGRMVGRGLRATGIHASRMESAWLFPLGELVSHGAVLLMLGHPLFRGGVG